MDIFIRKIPYSTSEAQLKRDLARVLHGSNYEQFSREGLLNFEVTLFADRRNGRKHSGCGLLTLPITRAGERFLAEYGGMFALRPFVVANQRLQFERSARGLQNDLVRILRLQPYLDPQIALDQERLAAQLHQSSATSIDVAQLGWECRDGKFSSEWEARAANSVSSNLGSIEFSAGEREMIIKLSNSGLCPGFIPFIRIRSSTIVWLGIDCRSSSPSAFFSLSVPPMFGVERTDQPTRRSVVAFDEAHRRHVAYTSLALRVVFSNHDALEDFKHSCTIVAIRTNNHYPAVESRNLFSISIMEEVDRWLAALEWPIAFKCDAFLKGLLLDPCELLSMRQKIQGLVWKKGVPTMCAILDDLTTRLQAAVNGDEDYATDYCNTPTKVLAQVLSARRRYSTSQPSYIGSTAVFQCYHATVTPTTVHLSGPFPERSNRIIRKYPGCEHHFLRVIFADENHLQLRFERSYDGARFVQERIGTILREGLTVAGRRFQFLGYSMSALKEHAVWFLHAFSTTEFASVTPERIRNEIGDFEKVIQMPALYGARLSQAFSATDSSITVRADQLIEMPDVERNGHVFTDGVGTISLEYARDIWNAMNASKKRNRSRMKLPFAFQIRLGGSKGMVSIDPTLKGRVIYTRPSMTKFESLSLDVEVAMAFQKPSNMFLNRPLIMLLEGLGVPREAFLELQRDTVRKTKLAASSIETAGPLLETYGLGSSYRLPALFQRLRHMGISFSEDLSHEDPFIQRILGYSVNHILRELRNHARIPVPGAWTLVGVVDVHSVLKPGEVICCIRRSDDDLVEYIEGQVFVTRSPVIHPGDIQPAYAIGRPPQGSPYDGFPPTNTIVFSVEGDRPLASYLGGGDYDGDVFHILTQISKAGHSLFPRRVCTPGAYPPVKRKDMGRRCTIEDIAGFVTDYLINDLLGIISDNWLLIADLSLQSIEDPDCLTLAALHSKAVDYPKSGIPVTMSEIKWPKNKHKPDWKAPETVASTANNPEYYQSTCALGHLYRDIKLVALSDARDKAKEQQKQLAGVDDDDDEELESAFAALALGTSQADPSDQISILLRASVAKFIVVDDNDTYEEDCEQFLFQLFNDYASTLKPICFDHSLYEGRRRLMLTEEEVVVGTIVANTSQPRRRRDLIARLRERTATLVTQIQEELSGDDDYSMNLWLHRCWSAWKMTARLRDKGLFGSQSFSYIVLGSLFNALNENEQALND